MTQETPVPIMPTSIEDPPNLGGATGAWLSAIWKAGVESMLFLCAGVLLGCALCATVGDKFIKLGIVDYKLSLFCLGIACCLFFIAIAFRLRFIKRSGDKWASADAKEAAFRQARGEVEKERHEVENDHFHLSNWFSQKQEDEVIDLPKILSLEISQKPSHLEASVTLCPLHNGQSVSIANLVVGWKFTGDQPLWLPMFVGERVLNEIQEFKVNFPMVFNHAVSGSRLVGFSVTKNHIHWKDWSGQCDA